MISVIVVVVVVVVFVVYFFAAKDSIYKPVLGNNSVCGSSRVVAILAGS